MAAIDELTHCDGPVHRLELDGKTFIVVGTAHISKKSAELVRRVLEEEKPDRLCVELDDKRFEALTHRKRWATLDLKQIIRKKQLSTLLVNLFLASYQKKLGKKLGVLPGMELVEAVRVAEERDIPITLADRDVRVTLRRAWQSVSFFKKILLLSGIVGSAFDDQEIDEEQIEELLKGDVISELMKELGQTFPTLKKALIDERDSYIAQKVKTAEGERIVVVVGAGHVEGIMRILEEDEPVDLEALEVIPPVSPLWKWVGWGVPATIVAAIAMIGWNKGLGAAGDNVVYWVLANGLPACLGAVAALAHPLTIITAFVAAPITSLTPVIGAGYVTAFVQAYLRPPRVHELETVMEDISSPKKWWQSRLLRIFLAFVLPGLGSFVGTLVGGVEIFSNLFN